MACKLVLTGRGFWLLAAFLLAPWVVTLHASQSQPLAAKDSEGGSGFVSPVPAEQEPAGDVKHLTRLFMSSAPSYLLVDDFNQDGRLDVGLTAHGGNHSRLFLQLGTRQWQAGPEIPEVGMHPGELMSLEREDGHRAILQFAEGDNKLRVMSPTAEGGLKIDAEIAAIFPRAGTQFHWPGWGLGLAFAPFTQAMIILVEGFEPDQATARAAHFLRYKPDFAKTQQVAAADLEGDGIDEILFMNPPKGQLMVIRYPCGDAKPAIEGLSTFPQMGPARFVIPADIDQDGDLDILVPGETGQASGAVTALNLLMKDDSGGWRQSTITLPAMTREEGGIPGLRGTAFGLDKDGLGYILTAGYDRLSLVKIPFGWEGDEHDIRQVHLTKPQGIPTLELKDLDGDGWLDAILAGGMGDINGGVVLYGPLWDSFAELDGKDLVSGGEITTTAEVK
jgi:hypothetical protein